MSRKNLVFVVLFLGSFLAKASDVSDGCGLGWEVTDKKTFSATTTRATTNITIPPTFGMTTGTIGCEQHGLVKVDKEAMYYVEVNREELEVDMAQGGGQYIQAMAQTMKVKKQQCFSRALQKHYSEILGDNPSSSLLTSRIQGIALTDCNG